MIIIYIDAYICLLKIIIQFLCFFLVLKKIDRYKVGYRAAYTTTEGDLDDNKPYSIIDELTDGPPIHHNKYQHSTNTITSTIFSTVPSPIIYHDHHYNTLYYKYY